MGQSLSLGRGPERLPGREWEVGVEKGKEQARVGSEGSSGISGGLCYLTILPQGQLPTCDAHFPKFSAENMAAKPCHIYQRNKNPESLKPWTALPGLDHTHALASGDRL